jgi:DNA mismatch repair ATPase MutS
MGYSVVISDQGPQTGGVQERKITMVCSPMVPASLTMTAEQEDTDYFTSVKDSSNIMNGTNGIGATPQFNISSMDRIGCSVLKEGECCSVVVINLTTGKINLFESLWNSKTFLEILFLKYHPVEVVWYVSGTKEDGLVMEIQDRFPAKHHHRGVLEKEYTKLMYQEEVMKKAGLVDIEDTGGSKASGMTIHHIHEQLGVERYPITASNLVAFIDFIYQHYPLLVQRLHKPVWESLDKEVDFLPHTLHELHLVDGKPSIFEIMDKTSTKMGKRRYRTQWFRPICSSKDLTRDLEKQEEFLKRPSDEIKKERSIFSSLHDWEVTLRAFSLKKFSVRRFLLLWRDLESLLQESENGEGDIYTSKTSGSIQDIQDILQSLETTFCRSAMEDYNWQVSMLVTSSSNTSSKSSSNTSIKNKEDEEFPTVWVDRVIDDLGLRSYSNLSSIVRVQESNDDIYITLKSSKNVKINVAKLNDTAYSSRTMGSGTNTIRIYHPEWSAWYETRKRQRLLREQENKALFYSQAVSWCQENFDRMEKIMDWIIEKDILLSKVSAILQYRLCRPTFLEDSEDSSSSFQAVALRNPIVEITHPRSRFIENDFKLDNEEKKGILLFGQNSAGKSTYVKSIGINTWLAQTGHYVFAESFHFKPFQKILTKLSIHDNIFKGQSTFVAEMLDLKYILYQCQQSDSSKSSENILVLADELTAGTETWSATSIVATTLSEFMKKPNVCFVMTTHLHTLKLFSPLYNNQCLDIRHIHFSNEGEKDPYFRKLRKGEGPVMYGIETAEYLDFPGEFIARCFHVRKALEKHILYNTTMLRDISNDISNDILNGDDRDSDVGLDKDMDKDMDKDGNVGPELVLTLKKNQKQKHGSRLVTKKTSRYNKHVYMDACVSCGTKMNLESHHIIPQKSAVSHPVTKEKVIPNHTFRSIHEGSNIKVLCQGCHDREHS